MPAFAYRKIVRHVGRDGRYNADRLSEPGALPVAKLARLFFVICLERRRAHRWYIRGLYRGKNGVTDALVRLAGEVPPARLEMARLAVALVGAIGHRLYTVNTVSSGSAARPDPPRQKMDPEEARRRQIAEMKV